MFNVIKKSARFKYAIALLFIGLSSQPVYASEQQEEIIQKAYIAYYARPADPLGLDYWVDRISGDSHAIAGIIGDFGNSPEYTDRFSSLSNQELVNNIYLNLFNRDADSSGLSYYVGLLDNGTSGLAQIALQILNGANAGTDLEIINNKINFAQFYTEQVSSGKISYSTNLELLINTLASVTESLDTLIDAKEDTIGAIIK